jgi:predicted HTH domain antitoxin
MMTTVEIQVPEAVLISLKETPESIVQELRMLAAVKLFELGKLSSGRAAELAGLSRVAFLMALGRYCVSPLQLADDELAQDIDHA